MTSILASTFSAFVQATMTAHNNHHHHHHNNNNNNGIAQVLAHQSNLMFKCASCSRKMPYRKKTTLVCLKKHWWSYNSHHLQYHHHHHHMMWNPLAAGASLALYYLIVTVLVLNLPTESAQCASSHTPADFQQKEDGSNKFHMSRSIMSSHKDYYHIKTRQNGVSTRYYNFEVNYTNVTRLNHTKSMMLVNGQFPGPSIHAHEGDTIVVRVTSFVKPNITIHWHGVRQLRTGWYDGVPYVTQCPLQQNASFTYRFQLLNQTGVLWYHAHTSWHRASIHGAIIVQPRKNVLYPFTTPSQEFTIILGEWWNTDVEQVIADALARGGGYNTSDALTINGQPGFLYNSSAADAYRINITSGGMYLLRLVNSCMNFALYVGVANHSLTVVQLDSAYAVPFDVDFVLIAPGQTLDVLLHANHSHGRYYLASSVFSIPNTTLVPFPNVSATALVEYVGVGAASELHHNNNDDSTVTNNNNMMLPMFPAHNDSAYQQAFDAKQFSFNTSDQTFYIPQTVDIHLLFTVGYGLASNTSCYPLAQCEGYQGYRLLGSVNNITYKAPTPNKSNKPFLQYGYEYDRGHLTSSTSRSSFNLTFPDHPEHIFNYTGSQLPLSLWFPENGTRLSPIPFNSSVELVLQDTSILQFEIHPFHLHGNSFYIVGSGSGNYDPATSPATFNLVNPPLRNTYGVPYGGWVAIRFRADNPGAWLLHCHIEIHQSWGMETVFFVHEGHGSDQRLPPPPAHYPLC